ncbi:acetylhydrolase [Streptomyces anthocyanicus]|uniref:alpha/beta hydrolase n=1 Tax=Streptomyces anthocyanicus TaxID=68174 RepID=UPI00166FF502|nr:alpha/beta hydrolase [Streptomyces anthocyanicus]GGL79398.1 acetylhydrolase [Streptomyces anthocyanicus]
MHNTPVDPDVIALFAELGSPSSPVAAADLTAEELRRTMRESIAIFTRGTEPIPVHRVTDEFVQGRGGKIPVRLYHPETPTSVMVYLHGGAWITGDIDTHDPVTRRLSRDTGALVVSVDYRMLPEHPFPAPFDDAYDAVVWARSLHPGLPLLVAGDSAGGTLSACVALRARDVDGPRVDGQVLVYPGIDDNLDAAGTHACSHCSDDSIEDLRFFLDQYGSHEAAAGSPYALPGRATSLAGLPAAVIAIAGHDLLGSSEKEYARRLQDDGVPVTVQFDPELVHSWIDFAPRVPAADRAFTRLTDAVNDLVRRLSA